MESFDIRAGKNEDRIPGTTYIQFRNPAVIDTAEVAHREGRGRSFPAMHNPLHSKEKFRCAICAFTLDTIVDKGFRSGDEFQSARHGELDNLDHALPGRKLRRVPGAKRARFKLQIPDRRDGGWGRYRRSARICFGTSIRFLCGTGNPAREDPKNNPPNSR